MAHGRKRRKVDWRPGGFGGVLSMSHAFIRGSTAALCGAHEAKPATPLRLDRCRNCEVALAQLW